jgi:hypothetical protein
MSGPLSLRTVLRRTFGIYAEQHALVPLAAAIMAAAVALNRLQVKHSLVLAIATLLVTVVAFGLFVGVVVLLVADAMDCRPRRSARELLKGALSALGPLLLVVVVSGITITLLTTIESIVIFGIFASFALSAGANVFVFILGLPIVSILILVPELFLLTTWSVCAAVAVLERPGGLRALGRSRELVRGNGWRVLALILVLAVPLAAAVGAIDRATGSASDTSGLVARLLVAALIAPIPVLAAAVLYFELRRAKPSPAPAVPTPPHALPPNLSLP